MPGHQTDSSETRSLLDAAQAGNRESLDRLFRRHQRYLTRVVELRTDSNLLRQIAIDRLLMWRRKYLKSLRYTPRGSVPLPDQSSVQLAHQLIARGGAPIEHMAARELAQRVREAMDRLRDSDREILVLRHFEGLSLQEIACLLDIEPAAARKRHGRALLRLRKELIEDGLRESGL